jgi:hypothetical protein
VLSLRVSRETGLAEVTLTVASTLRQAQHSGIELEVDMKKILALVVFFFAIGVTSSFGQEDAIEVLECSNDFKEIGAVFQRRVHNASSDYKYFFHDESTFDIENGAEGEVFDRKAKRKIGNKKYFIFETFDSDVGIYLLSFVNREDSKAILFFFINNDELEEAIPCSQAEINKALRLYLGL